jgi:hypothetical protein
MDAITGDQGFKRAALPVRSSSAIDVSAPLLGRAVTLGDWKAWIGRSHVAEDVVTPTPVETERGSRIDLGEMRRQGRLETRYQSFNVGERMSERVCAPLELCLTRLRSNWLGASRTNRRGVDNHALEFPTV